MAKTKLKLLIKQLSNSKFSSSNSKKQQARQRKLLLRKQVADTPLPQQRSRIKPIFQAQLTTPTP